VDRFGYKLSKLLSPISPSLLPTKHAFMAFTKSLGFRCIATVYSWLTEPGVLATTVLATNIGWIYWRSLMSRATTISVFVPR
jgi:hypothetical protein